MTLNLRQIKNVPCEASGIGWEERYETIGSVLASNGVLPDVIGLQEATGWFYCPTNPWASLDYESLAFLIDVLRRHTGKEYRIAYSLTTQYRSEGCPIAPGETTSTGCDTAIGTALLYDPMRLANIVTSSPPLALYDDRPDEAVRRSLPCCVPRDADAWVCSLVDGPPNGDQCARLTPTGPVLSIGVGGAGGAYSLLRLTDITTNNFVFQIYDLHLTTEVGARAVQIRELQEFVDRRYDSLVMQGLVPMIPPIVMGDFNDDFTGSPGIALYDTFATTSDQYAGAIDAIIVGRVAKYLSTHTVSIVRRGHYPSVGTNGECAWRENSPVSDHCMNWVELAAIPRGLTGATDP